MRLTSRSVHRPIRRGLVRLWPWAGDLILLGLLGILLLLCVYRPYLHHDCAFYLTAGLALVDGQPLVRDTNPPLIVYLNTIPAAISRWTHGSIVTAAQGCMLAVLLWSLAMLRRLLPLTPAAFNRSESTLCGGLVVTGCLYVYLQGNFGQREQIFVLLYLPWMMLRLARYNGQTWSRWSAILIGVLAFLGTGLKPHFMAMLMAVELLQLGIYRRWAALAAPEIWAYLISGGLYLLHFFVIPGMADYYFRLIPFIYTRYVAYAMPRGEIMQNFTAQPVHLFLAFLLVVALWAALRTHVRLRGLLASFGLLIVLSFLTYLHQAKGWSYHLIPLTLFGGLLGGGLVILSGRVLRLSLPGRNRADREYPVVGMAGLLVVAFLMFPALPGEIRARQRTQPWEQDPVYQAILKYTAPREQVVCLATSVWPGFPALTYADRRAGSRHQNLVPLAMAYFDARDYRSWDQSPADERELYDELCADLRQNRPRLVLVNTWKKPQACPDFFSVDEYFRRRGFYETALAGYQEMPGIEGFRIFVWPKTPASEPARQSRSGQAP